LKLNSPRVQSEEPVLVASSSNQAKRKQGDTDGKHPKIAKKSIKITHDDFKLNITIHSSDSETDFEEDEFNYGKTFDELEMLYNEFRKTRENIQLLEEVIADVERDVHNELENEAREIVDVQCELDAVADQLNAAIVAGVEVNDLIDEINVVEAAEVELNQMMNDVYETADLLISGKCFDFR